MTVLLLGGILRRRATRLAGGRAAIAGLHARRQGDGLCGRRQRRRQRLGRRRLRRRAGGEGDDARQHWRRRRRRACRTGGNLAFGAAQARARTNARLGRRRGLRRGRRRWTGLVGGALERCVEGAQGCWIGGAGLGQAIGLLKGTHAGFGLVAKDAVGTRLQGHALVGRRQPSRHQPALQQADVVGFHALFEGLSRRGLGKARQFRAGATLEGVGNQRRGVVVDDFRVTTEGVVDVALADGAGSRCLLHLLRIAQADAPVLGQRSNGGIDRHENLTVTKSIGQICVQSRLFHHSTDGRMEERVCRLGGLWPPGPSAAIVPRSRTTAPTLPVRRPQAAPRSRPRQSMLTRRWQAETMIKEPAAAHRRRWRRRRRRRRRRRLPFRPGRSRRARRRASCRP